MYPEAELRGILLIKLLEPGGKKIIGIIKKMIIPKNIKRFRSRMKIAGLTISKEGDYIFQVSKKEENEKNFNLVSELPLEVKIVLNKPLERKIVN